MSTTIAVVSKELCAGCEDCVSICPGRAISVHKKMQKGKNPFAKTYRGDIAVLHLAVVDAKKCDGCGKCRDACHWDAIFIVKAAKCPNCKRIIIPGQKSCQCGEQFCHAKTAGHHTHPSDTKSKHTHSEPRRHESKQKKDIDHAAAPSQQEVTWSKDDMEDFFKPIPSAAHKQSAAKSSVHSGKANVATCPSCHSALRPGAKFCTKCGKAVISHQQPH